MKTEIYEYLIAELYPLPGCGHCQYSDIDMKRVPCDRCRTYEKYKLHKGHQQDVKNLVKGIMKIVKENEKKK